MKSYLGLVPISARVRKKQSRMTRICIILAVFLVTALFSMADMWIRAEKAEMIRRHGNYHIKIQNVPENQTGQIISRPDIEVAARTDVLNPDAGLNYYINDKKIVLYGTEESYISDIRNYPLRENIIRRITGRLC